jgi:hypothetical protein
MRPPYLGQRSITSVRVMLRRLAGGDSGTTPSRPGNPGLRMSEIARQREAPHTPARKRTRTCVAGALHMLQPVYRIRNERVRPFLQG